MCKDAGTERPELAVREEDGELDGGTEDVPLSGRGRAPGRDWRAIRFRENSTRA